VSPHRHVGERVFVKRRLAKSFEMAQISQVLTKPQFKYRVSMMAASDTSVSSALGSPSTISPATSVQITEVDVFQSSERRPREIGSQPIWVGASHASDEQMRRGGDLSYVEFSLGDKESFTVGDCIYVSKLAFDASGKEVLTRSQSSGSGSPMKDTALDIGVIQSLWQCSVTGQMRMRWAKLVRRDAGMAGSGGAEDGLFQSSDVVECSVSRCIGKFMLLSNEDYLLRSWATTTDHLYHVC
jgi:hypothetical protein